VLCWQFSSLDGVAALCYETVHTRAVFAATLMKLVSVFAATYVLGSVAGVAADGDLNVWASADFGRVEEAAGLQGRVDVELDLDREVCRLVRRGDHSA
jgi:hypothetical protein